MAQVATLTKDEVILRCFQQMTAEYAVRQLFNLEGHEKISIIPAHHQAELPDEVRYLADDDVSRFLPAHIYAQLRNGGWSQRCQVGDLLVECELTKDQKVHFCSVSVMKASGLEPIIADCAGVKVGHARELVKAHLVVTGIGDINPSA